MTKEEAIKIIREARCTSPLRDALECLIPELAESEDERIRKWLYDYFKTIGSTSWLHEKDMPHEQILAYLEKQKENIEKEYVFRPLVGTDITIAAEQAIRRVMEGDHLVLAFNGWYVPVDKYATTKGLVDSYDTFIEKQKEQKPEEGREYSCPDCGTTSVCTNDESEGDKRYREGVRYALQQTEDYTIGKTFKGLIPCWVNAPSELQSAYKYHGKNVVIMHENNGGFRCVCVDDEKPVTFHLPEDTLFVEGWRKPEDRFEEAREKYQVEWSEEDEKMMNEIITIMDGGKVTSGTYLSEYAAWLKSLRPQKLDASKLENFDPVDVFNRIRKEWPMAWEKVVGKQEWSEEDDACYETIKGILEDNLTEEDKPEYVLSWFKLHCFRPSWKPSEEQMEALKKEADKYWEVDGVDPLYTLWQDLQKL